MIHFIDDDEIEELEPLRPARGAIVGTLIGAAMWIAAVIVIGEWLK